MSTDRLALAALEVRTKARLRYFERVSLHFHEDHIVKCYLAIGDHALYLVHSNLNSLVEGTSHISLEHISAIAEDTKSVEAAEIRLTSNRPDSISSSSILVHAEHRTRLLKHLRSAWQTSYLCRNRATVELLVEHKALTKGHQQQVLPFPGYQVATHDGYSFFIKKDYVNTSHSTHSSASGTFANPNGLTLTVQVQEPVPLSDLEENADDRHIRWVAIRQRQAVCKELTSPLLMLSNFYHKKMNLANDPAQWTGWEMLVKSDTEVRALIALRRQYLPPLADSAQDIFVSLQCPKHAMDQNRGLSDASLLLEARLAVDSLAPLVQNCTQPQSHYRSFIQAKLNALLFDEDAMLWLKGSMNLTPAFSLEREARAFVKSVLKILQEETVLRTPDLLKDLGDDIPTVKEPITVPYRMRAPGLQSAQDGAVDDEADPTVNAWRSRVARYLAYCFEGGLCASRLSLSDITDVFLTTPQSLEKIDEVILFLLHARPKDMTKPYTRSIVRYLVQDPSIFESYTFNDRVMQALVDLGWFEQALKRSTTRGFATNSVDFIDLYATFLARLLTCQRSSINLKAAACRQITARVAVMERQHGVLCAALMETMRDSNIFLRTYATVALVTMAGFSQTVHNKIVEMDGIPICISNLMSSDDDLIRYTLSLLAQLTRSVGRVKEMHPAVTDIVMTLLDKTPRISSKQQLLAELASVVGQLCNDLDAWKAMCQHPCRPTEKLTNLYTLGPEGGHLRSKVIYALKMFIDRPIELGQGRRESITQLVKPILDELQAGLEQVKNGHEENFNLDYAANAILLLGALSKSSHRVTIASHPNANEVLQGLNLTKLGQMDSTRDRLHKLTKRIAGERARGRP